MTRVLRDWQREAVDAVHAEWAAGRTRTAVVAATGLGKSSVIGHLAVEEVRAGGRVLILAHREELLAQLAATVQAFDPSIPVGVIQAGRHEARRPVLVASVATLRREARQRRTPPPTMIIVDECHRAVSDGYLTTLRWAGAFDGVRTLGVTATMTRGDKRGLGDVWQSAALVRDIAYGIEQGYLVTPHGRVVVADHLDLGKAKVRAGDYGDGELGEMVSQDVDQIVKAWCEHAADRITVAFCPTVDSARQLAEEFTAHGVAAEYVTGNTPTPARQAMYARLAAGTTRVLVNVFVLVEGWDCPPVSCVLMCRPTKLPGVYIQAVGRGLRLAPGKLDCLVLDVVGASRAQRLVSLVDLLPSAQVNRDEIEALPCEVCGGHLLRQAPSDAAPTPCVCEAEPGAGRDPDGGRTRLQGPARYAAVDLLGLAPKGAAVRWQATEAGVPFCSAGDTVRRYGVLWDEGRGRWSGGHCAARGAHDGVWLVEGVPLAVAREAVEAWALDAGHEPAPPWWKTRQSPSAKQLALAARLRIEGAELMTKGALSDAIDVRSASRRLDVKG